MDHTQSAAKCNEHAQWLQNGIYRGHRRFFLTLKGKNNDQSEMHL